MKIAYIYSEISIKGGADKVLTQKANYLATHGYEVLIITEAQMGRPLSFSIVPSVRHIDMGLDFNKQYTQGVLRRAYTYFSLMRKYRIRLKRILEQEKPDIVITTMGRSLDFIASLHDGSIKIGEAHTTKEHLRNLHLMEERGGFYKMVAHYMHKKMCNNASKLSALVLLTERDAESWAGITESFIIPNSIVDPPHESSLLDSKEAIMVGRYNDAKGYDYMVEAWAAVHEKHPDWTLNIYGSGELHDQVKQWIEDRHLQSTMIMHDPVDNITEKYMQSSICVLSSRYEGFSMAILEAMSCGVPCVSFDCPHGPRTIIHNEEDGLLVEHLNVKALANSICRLIEDETLRKKLGRNAKQNVKRYSQDEVMGKWDSLFRSLTQRQE
jgi:glycosyltransferase involved in cell wall biosynthesis